MNPVNFFYSKKTILGTSISLEIDQKSEEIASIQFKSLDSLDSLFQDSFDDIIKKCTGMKVTDIKKLPRDFFKGEPEQSLGQKPISPLGLTLLWQALEDFTGEIPRLSSERDLICLCFGVTSREVESQVLSDKNFELKDLISKTRASSACGTCRELLTKTIEKVRLKHGLIKGLDHSKSRFDQSGHWVKINGMYPGPLLLTLDRLKEDWLVREEMEDKYKIILKNIEGFHLDVEIHGARIEVREQLLVALSEYYQSKLGVLFFLH